MIEYENLGKLNHPFFEELKSSFNKTLESGWYVLGKRVEEFERKFGAFIGSSNCIGVASGLDALFLSLKAFDFPEGAEVLVPSNTYIATILSILHCGLQPILVEPDIRTYNIDPDKLEEQISSRTVAVMVVHLYGKPCEMDKIMPITRKHNLAVIEDCAQSHGATFNGICTGNFGDCGAFSFYPTKNLGSFGDAGAITTSNSEITLKLRKIRNYGSSAKYHNEYVGYNSRLDEMQAAFLSVKLAWLDNINAHKRGLAAIYLEGLKDDFVKPIVTHGCTDVYHIFNVRHPRRDRLKQFLLQNEIMTEIHYPIPPHRQIALAGKLLHYEYPLSEEIHATTLSLPISYFHNEGDVYRIVEVMNSF